jgi:hypothetical protein
MVKPRVGVEVEDGQVDRITPAVLTSNTKVGRLDPRGAPVEVEAPFRRGRPGATRDAHDASQKQRCRRPSRHRWPPVGCGEYTPDRDGADGPRRLSPRATQPAIPHDPRPGKRPESGRYRQRSQLRTTTSKRVYSTQPAGAPWHRHRGCSSRPGTRPPIPAVPASSAGRSPHTVVRPLPKAVLEAELPSGACNRGALALIECAAEAGQVKPG